MNLVTAMQTKNTVTENGAITHSTTGSMLLDWFANGAAMRLRNDSDIVRMFAGALGENPLYALKTLFYFRDVRGGQGERKIFRVCLNWLAVNQPTVVIRLLPLIAEYGRWDDLYSLRGTPAWTNTLNVIKTQLEADLEAKKPSLLAKWLPREGSANSEVFRDLIKFLGWSPKRFRKTVSGLTKVVEQQMCSNKWETVVFDHVPSKAMIQYRKAFAKHTPTLWEAYKAGLTNGTRKINAGAIYPHDLIKQIKDGTADTTIDAQWSALPNYCEGDQRVISVVDISGSMFGIGPSGVSPGEVAIGLGIYCAERLTGPFQNCLITFTTNPKFHQIPKTTDLALKYRSVINTPAGYDTNLQAVFEMILSRAIQYRLTAEELPSTILVLSDMEFNNAGPATNLEAVKAKYKAANYPCPRMVFWNLQARGAQVPAKMTDTGVNMVSGFSPAILKSILGGKPYQEETPMEALFRTLDVPRYEAVK